MFKRFLLSLVALSFLPVFVFASTDALQSLGCQLSSKQFSAAGYQLEFTFSIDQVKNWVDSDDMPAPTRWIAVPSGTQPKVNIIESEFVAIPKSSQDFFSNHKSSYTAQSVTIGKSVDVRGISFVPVTFTPVLIEQGGGSFITKVLANIQVPAGDIGWSNLSNNLREVWGDLLLNNPGPSRDDGGDAAGMVYVVPQDARVQEALEPLYEWRRMQGFDIRELFVNNNDDGETIQARIRDINRLTIPIEYVCLVGDVGGEFNVPTMLRGTSDYGFGLMDRDDPLPDAAVGRISFSSIPQLQRMVEKIVSYEQNPQWNDPSWLRRASVCAGNEISGLSTILVSRWVRDELLDFGFDSVDTLWYSMNGSVEDHIRRSFDRGSAFVNYRGWTGMEDFSAQDAARLTNAYLPVAVLLGCNTGDFEGLVSGYTEALLRADGGAIGAIGSATIQSRVNYNNAMMAGFYRGVLDDNVVRQGWALARAKLELFATYGSVGNEWVISHAYWTNLMGDPATTIWLGEAQEVEIEAPDVVEISYDPIEVVVTADGEPVAGARVGLYKEFDQTVVACTDENGIALIEYDFRLMSGGIGQITVTGDRIMPESRDIRFNVPQNLLSMQGLFLMDNQMVPNNGNGDGIVQPMEVFTLTVMVRNNGQAAIRSPIDAVLTTEHDGMDIVNGNFRLNNDIGANMGGQFSFVLEALGNFPDREPIPMHLVFTAGENEWQIDFELQGEAPRWEFFAFDQDIAPNPGDDLVFDILLRNTGSLDVDQSESELVSLNELCMIFEGVGFYDEMFVDDTAGAGEGVYELNIDADIPPGIDIDLVLNIFSNNGYEASIPIVIHVREGGEVALSTGPDEYGYYAIDDRDDFSNIAPDFAWVELDPDQGGIGTNTGMLDQGEDDDKSIAIDLPFEFQYYGQEQNQLTICTNGWAAFGNQSNYVDFRNMPIGSPQGPSAQLCPWWDDLFMFGRTGEVYTGYDEENHRFIVEWSRLRRWVGPDAQGTTETFELILLDPDWHPTETGDGDIIFQYLTSTAEARVDFHGTPYATIGINNPNDDGGLQYAYWNTYAPGASVIRNVSAIRFATSESREFGVANGMVSASNGAPIPGAIVRASTGGWAVCDNFGNFVNLNVLAGIPFTLHATRVGFNERVSAELNMNVGAQQVVNFELTHPEITLDVEAVSDTVQAGHQNDFLFEIANNGDGELEYNIELLPENQEGQFTSSKTHLSTVADLWEPLGSFDISEITGDSRILGVTYLDGIYWVSGGADGDAVNYFYQINQNGNQINRLEQPCEDSWGMRDLAFDGVFIYGGCRELIYKMDNRGRLVNTILSPLIPARAIAVNPTTGDIWIANDGEPIHQLNAQGEVLSRFNHSLHPYGLAWHPDDVDGYSLYIFSADGDQSLMLSKMNPTTGDIVTLNQFELLNGDRAGGCELSVDLDSRIWTMMAIVQNSGGDRLELFDAGANYSWITATPSSGVIPAEQSQEITLSMSALRLDQGIYSITLSVTHNAAGDAIEIPVELVVEPQLADAPDDPPSDFVLNTVYPNPTNGAGMISFYLPHESDVVVSVWDALGRQMAQLANGRMKAGSHQVVFTADGLPSGVYFVRLQSDNGVLTKKFALLK